MKFRLFSALLTLFSISLHSQTTAAFTPSESDGCAPFMVSFTDNSTGNIVDWLWDFGNGETSNLQNPTVTYNDGSFGYNVQLTVTDDVGFSTSTSEQIAVRDARFATVPASGCAIPHVVFFTDQSVLPDTWFWDFGDGNTSTLQNPVHAYRSFGEFTITLTITDTIIGCSSLFSSSVSVQNISSEFTTTNSGEGVFETGCGPLSVSFEDLSSGPVSDYAWDFGDGNTSNLQDPTHTYEEPGLYGVTLTVTAENGCTSMVSYDNSMEVLGSIAGFSADNTSGIDELSVSFTDESSGAGISAWFWDFGDGNTSTIQNPTHLYTAPGTYDVSLTITDNDDCTSSLLRAAYIQIDATPVPTMGEWGIIIFALLLLNFGLRFIAVGIRAHNLA